MGVYFAVGNIPNKNPGKYISSPGKFPMAHHYPDKIIWPELIN